MINNFTMMTTFTFTATITNNAATNNAVTTVTIVEFTIFTHHRRIRIRNTQDILRTFVYSCKR
jgi:hypothetical protein